MIRKKVFNGYIGPISFLFIICFILVIMTSCANNIEQNIGLNDINIDQQDITTDEEVYLDMNDSENKNIELKYPVMRGLDDIYIQNQINEELKIASLNVLNDFSSLEDMTISTAYEIKLNSNKILSVLYIANSMHVVQAYPLIRTQTINIDMKTGKKLSNSDIIYVDDNFLSIFKEKFELISEYESDEVKESVIEYVYNYISLDELKEESNGSFPEINYFLTDNTVNISIAIPFSIGSYAVFSADYSDIKDNMLINN